MEFEACHLASGDLGNVKVKVHVLSLMLDVKEGLSWFWEGLIETLDRDHITFISGNSDKKICWMDYLVSFYLEWTIILFISQEKLSANNCRLCGGSNNLRKSNYVNDNEFSSWQDEIFSKPVSSEIWDHCKRFDLVHHTLPISSVVVQRHQTPLTDLNFLLNSSRRKIFW